MFGILYKCNDGRDYYCTSSRFAHFSEDIESIAEFAQQKTAEKIANHFTKTNDFEELYGTGKLLVIKVVKVPLSLKEIQLIKLKSGYRIYSEENDEYYSGNKNPKSFNHLNLDDLHCSTVYKSEKEAQKTIDAMIKEFYDYAFNTYEPGHNRYEYHVKMYETDYIIASKLKIVYIE